MWLDGPAKGSVDVLPALLDLKTQAVTGQPLQHQIVWPGDSRRTSAKCTVRETAAGFELDYGHPSVRSFNEGETNYIGCVALSHMPDGRLIAYWRDERSDVYERASTIVLFESEAKTFGDASQTTEK